MRFPKVRVSVPILACAVTLAVTLALTGVAAGASQVNPPRFIERVSSVTGLHATSGLAGFPARDYLARGGSLVRAPFSGCVPTNRPWGWLPYQSPSEGFGGARVYLTQTKTGRQGYFAHFGNPAFGGIFLKPGQCFRQGDPMGHLWDWPGNPGRSHIHFGWTGGDPLPRVVDRDGNFLIHEGPVWKPGPDGKIFPRPILRHEGKWWRVQVGERRVYQGGEEKAREVYNAQKLARTINLHFRRYSGACCSPDSLSPLIGWGLPMVRISRRYDVDSRLPAAIATCETSAGTNGNGPLVNNDFGLLVNGGAHRAFPSRKAAILYLAKLLDEKYVSKGLDTIAEIGAKYAPLDAGNDPSGKNSRWIGCVTEVYIDLNGTRFLVQFPELEKVGSIAKSKGCPEPGRWRVTRQGVPVFQCTYRPALNFYRDKLAWAERRNGLA